ncbi:MAG: permease [Pirellulaceae bacterium]|nr:MAG: permease [Pirellulaceae bacterium]
MGRWQIIAASVLWSTSGFFAKAPWFDGWPSEDRGTLLAFWRSAFAILILLPLVRRPDFRWPMLPMTACFAVMVWSFMTAMVYGPAANAIWLQYLAPAWVAMGCVLLLREPLQWVDLRLIAWCLAGVLIILTVEVVRGWLPAAESGVQETVVLARPWLATGMGLLSGVAFAGVVLCMRALRDMDSAWLITCNHGATALLLLPWVIAAEGSIAWSGYLALALFGMLQMSLPYVLFARGLRSASTAEASVLTLIEPLLVPVWVYVAWHEHPSYEPPGWWVWCGAALIFIGLVQRYGSAMRLQWRMGRYAARGNEGTERGCATEVAVAGERNSVSDANRRILPPDSNVLDR